MEFPKNWWLSSFQCAISKLNLNLIISFIKCSKVKYQLKRNATINFARIGLKSHSFEVLSQIMNVYLLKVNLLISGWSPPEKICIGHLIEIY